MTAELQTQEEKDYAESYAKLKYAMMAGACPCALGEFIPATKTWLAGSLAAGTPWRVAACSDRASFMAWRQAAKRRNYIEACD